MRKRLTHATLPILCLLASAAMAEIAQVPLVSQNWTPPNVMFTLDDSGSMADECIPSELCVGSLTIASRTINTNVGSVWRPLASGTSGYGKFSGDNFTTWPATYDPAILYARRIRASSINSAYYNPKRRYLPWKKADGSTYPNANPAAAPYNPLDTTKTLNLKNTFTTTSYFCKSPSSNDCQEQTETVDPAQYYVQTSGTTGNALSDFVQVKINSNTSFNKDADRTDCAAQNTCTQAEELQNFANWFSYYRNKLLAAKAAISNTFSVIPPETRLGYGVISKSPEGAKDAAGTKLTVPQYLATTQLVDGERTATITRGVRPFTGTDRQDFYNWLLGVTIPSGGPGTPLRGALKDVGSYYMRTDNAGPWAEVPGGTSNTAHLLCRRALHIMITDGAWNGASNGRDQLNYARLASGASPDATGLYDKNVDGSSTAPFQDQVANTLADVAMYYWKTNLRSDVAGSDTAVPVNAQEAALGRSATWPHLVNYMIGFGVKGKLDNPGDIPALQAGTKSWPAPTDDLSKIDDLWHAAWNSGGQYFSALDPKSLSDSLGTIIDSMRATTSTDVPLVMPSRFVTSEYTYIPSYQTKIWSGDLKAFQFDTKTGDRAKKSDGSYADAVWSAAAQLDLKSYADRNIFTAHPSTNAIFQFKFSDLKAQGLGSLLNAADDTEGQKLVDYLRGKSELEGTTYRSRTNGKLGDIVNATPLLVFDGEDAAYDFLPTSIVSNQLSYRQFLRYKKLRRGQVFVGANDGMLHAFDAKTGDETFAYIPKTVLGSIYKLAAPTYAHRYFVDGPLVEADVFDKNITTSNTVTGWRNILIGTGGAGANNIFAINVPVLSNGNANTTYAPTASDILWEVNSNDASFSDLGAVLQKPAVGVMRNGKWVVIVGNGYVTANGKAKLFIMDALTGAFIKSIDITATGANGLGGVRLVLDQERQITAAYAGDLQGNLWKFDLSSKDENKWGVAFGGNPLYKAKSASDLVEPITATPTYLAHPLGGNLVVFGTGKLFESADVNDNQVQSLYGIWDTVRTGQTSDQASDAISTQSSGTNADKGSSLLVQQVITPISGTDYFTASSKAVDYGTKRGWFVRMNINPSGLRLVFAPQLAVGKVFMQALSPNGVTTDPCAARQGKSVNFVLNPFTGSGSPLEPTFDVNGDGQINASDTTYQSVAINAVGVATADTGSSSFNQKLGAGLGTGAVSSAAGQQTVAGARKVLRRTWRHIVNRPRP